MPGNILQNIASVETMGIQIFVLRKAPKIRELRGISFAILLHSTMTGQNTYNVQFWLNCLLAKWKSNTLEPFLTIT